jgi:hypothetical protein
MGSVMKQPIDGKRRIRAAVLWVSAMVMLLPLAATAQNMVYHSPNDDGVNPGTALNLPIDPSTSLFLYLNAGSTGSQTGTPCSDGNGREMCGYRVIVDTLGGASIVDFIPDGNIVHSRTSSHLDANGLFALNPVLGPIRIGELRVASTSGGSEVVISGGQVVLAALQIEGIPMSIAANTPVPEPGFVITLGVGVVVLSLASTRRRRA